MNNNKLPQKAPKYSINIIGAKSELATRGLRELGLLKEEKHFTIIYVCQFCGRLINYSSTPCIFCSNYPKTKRGVIIVQALSSESMSVESLLAVSKTVKEKEDLEITISNLRNLVDEVLEDPQKFPTYQTLFRLTESLLTRSDLEEKARELSQKTKIFCSICGNIIIIPDKPCYFCCTDQDKKGYEENGFKNELNSIEKHIVALNGFLLFVENYLDFAENKEAFNELIFVSVYILNRIIEKDELPNSELKKYWRELLLQSGEFGNYDQLRSSISMDANGKLSIIAGEKEDMVSKRGVFEMTKLGRSLIYLFKS